MLNQLNNLNSFSLFSHFWPVFIPFNSSFKSCFTHFNRLWSTSIDEVTTGTYNSMSVILDAAFLGISTATTAGSVSGSASLVA